MRCGYQVRGSFDTAQSERDLGPLAASRAVGCCIVQVWVSTLRISKPVADKITEKHGITPQQVRAAVVGVEGLEGSWVYDRERGARIIIQVEIEEQNVLVVLYPADDIGPGTWRLGSAYGIRS